MYCEESAMEYFDIRTPEGKITGQIKERSQVHRDGDIHGTSHTWLFRKNARGEWEVLLQKRSADKDSFPGCYDISSAGHIPAGEDYLPSALRELKEELGITAAPEDMHYVGMHDAKIHTEFYGKPWNNHELSAVYVLFCDMPADQMKIQKEEIEEVRWISFSECLGRMKDGTLNHCIFEDEMEMLAGFLDRLTDD